MRSDKSTLLPSVQRTKAGPGDKEEAYVVMRTPALRLVAIVILTFMAGTLLYMRQQGTLDRAMYQWTERARQTRFFQHRTHAQYAMLGQELEQHLTRDAHESEMAAVVLERMVGLEDEYNANVTKAIARVVEQKPFGSLKDSEESLRLALKKVSEDLFTRQIALVRDNLVKRLNNEAEHALARRAAVHKKLASELEHEAMERDSFLNQPG